VTKTHGFTEKVLLLFLVLWGWACDLPAALGKKCPDQLYARHGGKNLYLDLYYPDTPPPRGGYPLIVCFHGGGWISGSKKRDLFFNDLTRSGFVIASVQYRLSTQAKYPEQLRDIRAAAEWLYDRASALKVNSDKIVAAGASAGGHLALLLALSQDREFAGMPSIPHDMFKAVCALYPPTDLVTIIPKERRDRLDNLVSMLLAGTINGRLVLARQGSPISYVSKTSPPVFFVHGDRDPLVPLEQSETMAKALHEDGVETNLVVYRGASHGFRPRPVTLDQIERFFQRHLGLR